MTREEPQTRPPATPGTAAIPKPAEAAGIDPQPPPAEQRSAPEPPRRARALEEEGGAAIRISSEQMSEEQRSYLARVIRWLEPPLRYEWSPKYTRPSLFVSLVTDGEPPRCRTRFNGPTTITFDLVIRGGSGTESRIEGLEITYK
jgi:hypothetical protein